MLFMQCCYLFHVITECPMGDEASFCKTMPLRDCYVSERTCCETCSYRKRVYETGENIQTINSWGNNSIVSFS